MYQIDSGFEIEIRCIEDVLCHSISLSYNVCAEQFSFYTQSREGIHFILYMQFKFYVFGI